jgi:hypothetical protein
VIAANKKTRAAMDTLVRAALDMHECEDLTPEQKFKAGQIYDLASSLETDLRAECHGG